MKYYLGRLVLGCRDWMEINAEQYATVKLHKAHLIRALEIEERFDILLGNYREFEEDILTIALSHAIVTNVNDNDFKAQRGELNRRIANFLSSARLYLDQLLHQVSAIYGSGSSQYVAVKNQMSRSYDESFSFRLMDTLRNHVQHRGVAAPGFTVASSLTDRKIKAQIAFTVAPKMAKEDLLEDSKINEKLLAEIRTLPESTDLTPHVREYMSRLNSIHVQSRKLSESDIVKWEATIRETIDLFKGHYRIVNDRDRIGLAIIQVDGDINAPVAEKSDVFMGFIDYRKHVTSLNRVRDDLTRTFATGQQQDLVKPK